MKTYRKIVITVYSVSCRNTIVMISVNEKYLKAL